MKKIIGIIFFISLFFISFSSAAITSVEVDSLSDKSYSHIWLGVSTGGYDLIAKKGTPYEFRVFIKNGMTNESMHNLEIIPSENPFTINSITPKSIDQIKPMEIRIFYVNVTIPPEILPGKYPVKFDLASEEFPTGVFFLESEVKIVERVKIELYIFYSFLIVLILFWLFYRKWKQNKK